MKTVFPETLVVIYEAEVYGQLTTFLQVIIRFSRQSFETRLRVADWSISWKFLSFLFLRLSIAIATWFTFHIFSSSGFRSRHCNMVLRFVSHQRTSSHQAGTTDARRWWWRTGIYRWNMMGEKYS